MEEKDKKEDKVNEEPDLAEESSKKIEVKDYSSESENESEEKDSVEENNNDTKDENSDDNDDNSEQGDSEDSDQTVTDKDDKPEAETVTEESTENASDNEAEPDIDENKTVGEAIDESEVDGTKTEEEIDEAVDEIVRAESDEVIAEADAKLEALKEVKNKKSFKQKVKDGFVAWWENKPIRYGTFAALFIILIGIILLPTTRYTMLNLFGVRVSSSMTIVDSQTKLPLKNINVALQDKTAKSDEDGNVQFTDLKLGSSELSITKIGYADNVRDIVLGWGSNPIGNQEIVATGEQFTFVLSDWLNGNKITKAEATAGENSAKADEEGKIVLTVGQEDISEVEVYLEADNYRTEKFTNSDLSKGEIQVKMVSSKKHTFVSNRSGEYDLYKIDIDKKNEEVLLGSTGKEREVPVVLSHPARNITAFISSRDGDENADGFILDGLFIIDVESGDTKRIARSEQIQLLGWSGDNLIFWQVVEGTSRANPERSKIISYNEITAERTELAAANYFNDIELVDETVYFAVSSYAVPLSQAKLYSIKIDGEDKKQLKDIQTWSIYRTAYNKLLFNTDDQKWYEKDGDSDLKEVGQQPAPQALKFVDSKNGENTAWVEIRDGKGVLLKSSTEDIKEEQVVSLPGLNEVLYWVNDTSVVFRVISNSETADYLIDFTDNEPIKITDVTATQNRYF